MTNLGNIIYELKTTKGLSDELIQIVIEDSLKAAYAKHFGTSDNAHVIIDVEHNEVALYSKKIIVETVDDDVTEITLEAAKEFEPDCEIGDEILLEIKPDQQFKRTEIQVANQTAVQRIREFEGDSLYSEFKNKEGEIVIGYYLRETHNAIIVDLGRTEGIMPKKFQSSRDIYRSGDRIKALIYEVNKSRNKFEVILSRTHTDFVKKIFELEVPELDDGTVEIVKIVREPGHRTKIAVQSLHSGVDPIGTCVGTKGVRINHVMTELDSERIDILRYDDDILTFIHNALSPAEVKQVIITDYAKKVALAIVEDEKLSIAIGKLGLNVRLANRLTDWSINIKTVSEFQEMDAAEEFAQVFEDAGDSEDEELNITKVGDLPDLDAEIIEKLVNSNTEYIEDLIQISNEELKEKGLSDQEIRKLRGIMHEFIDIDPDASTDEETKEVEATEANDDADAESYDSMKIDMIPIREEVLEKLKLNNIELLYDLLQIFSENKLDTIESLTVEERTHIAKVITDNVELE